MAAQSLIVALAGNPNVGKSTLFNALTGGRQHVGNWPGKTVEKKEGWTTLGGQQVMVVDLPGTYSLAAYSVEEIIAREFLLCDHPGTVIAVADAANLERNLYLVCQLIELGTPVILALNMVDMANSRGIRVDTNALSAVFGGIPVIEMIGTEGHGMDTLRQAILSHRQADSLVLKYDPLLETEISALQTFIEQDSTLINQYPARWLAINLLEHDPRLFEQFANSHTALLASANKAIDRVTETLGDDPETILTDQRYAFIADAVKQSVHRAARSAETTSERIDRIITHRLWGLPIFLGLMWVVFQITANVSAPIVDWVDGVITGPFSRWISALLSLTSLHGSWVESLLLKGIIAGVGGVLAFVPMLMLLYLMIAILEDSGYMARAAFVMDRLMQVIGLHGKSFLPLLIGFGCTVPAVYATRTLENERDRKLTGFLTTFMSCGARLPVYVLFATVFFGAQSGNAIFALYLLGILVALVTGLLFKRILYRGKPPQPFVMELPPYRRPNGKIVFSQTWERTSEFVRKAATLILACSVIVWLLTALPANFDLNHFGNAAPEESVFGSLSGAVAPLFAPAGFGNWQATGSLITGLAAKEVIVGTMGQIYVGATAAQQSINAEHQPILSDLGEIIGSFGMALVGTAQEFVNILPRTVNLLPFVHMPEADFTGSSGSGDDMTTLGAALTETFTPLSAAAFMVFVLLYSPCITTTAAMRHEFGTRWTLYQIGYTTLTAWVMAVIVYQGGLLLGLGG
ncbi:MAG: ferrous iron transport protein B [Anaerolineae bacterium]